MDWWHFLIFFVIIFAFIFGCVLAFIYIERRVIGRFQIRVGPNRTGPFGLLQPIADAAKSLLKESLIPDNADKFIFWLAPIIAFVPVFMVFAVVPFGEKAVLANVNVGILFVLASSSVVVLGVFMAGWGSSNKYSLLGAMRVIALLVSYEIPLVLSIVSVILIAGTLNLDQIVLNQNVPYILYQPLGFTIYFIASLAEIARSPFDMIEADSELVSGYHIEYSGMKFGLFLLAEYTEVLCLSVLTSILFLSGWKGWGTFIPPFVWLLIKVFIVFFVMMWVRSTLPRIRIDQIMAFAWKFMIPLAVFNLLLTAIEVLVWNNNVGTLP
ncbi:MAG: NADH-quinone oxidoreductase subunit NuoH, partial [Chloroflexi bacterium]|nr:NADH-quinone oxidoreductase subunit NuoH [Chloroflexota bacterium]